jgi:hypothetical protein
MKKSILLTLLSTLILQANTDYIQVGIGVSQIEEVSYDGINLQGSIGTIFPSGIGLEMKLTKSIENNEYKYDNIVGDLDLFTASLFTNYNIRMNNFFSIAPKIGVTYRNVDYAGTSDTIGYTKISGNYDRMVTSYGLDLYYDLNGIAGLYAGITAYNPLELFDSSNDWYDSKFIYMGYRYNFNYTNY